LKYILSIAFILTLCAFNAGKDLFYIPENWPIPNYDFNKNELTEEKILLGRALFYEPKLSANNSISCESCHSPFSAFTHIDHSLSHGIHDSIGNRNSPALMNLAWQNLFMWDGAVNNLDVQALAPISHPAEMGSTINEVVSKLSESGIYPALYFKAFNDSLITTERTLKALSAFLVSLISANSKYDRVKSGDEVFTPQEENGYKLFLENCSSCHSEPLFTTNNFANNGLSTDSMLQDTGRMKITQNPDDSLKFKIPTLRNIEYSFPYMHDGRFKKLREVINHYTNSVVPSKTLAPELKKPIILSSNEKTDLISFLMTLSDKEFVFNPKQQYPKELFLPSGDRINK